jgi:ABC-type polysaccharide/polyol phosphate transport system ATPase subunit
MILPITSNQIYDEPQFDTAVFLQNVSVHYRIPTEAVQTFKEYVIKLVKREIKHKSFSALNKINLDIKQGEIFGIMGRNGAGKSTLMKVISRVLIPKEGRVWIKGQVSPLLQLGAGFHPELTGRENIFLNATLLGHSNKEIESKTEEIIDFAGIGSFIEAPLRTYSSGMQSRLGFAVATAWQPDILILDEVLSVGDVGFQNKCYQRMAAFRDSGATVLMVSHSVESIRSICQKALWLDKGQVKAIGDVNDVCTAYEKEMSV